MIGKANNNAMMVKTMATNSKAIACTMVTTMAMASVLARTGEC